MRKSRRAEITIEVDQVITVRRQRRVGNNWCSDCGSEVMMLTPDEATSVVSLGTRAIFRMIDANQVHFAETRSGLVRLCLPSLLQAVGPQRAKN